MTCPPLAISSISPIPSTLAPALPQIPVEKSYFRAPPCFRPTPQSCTFPLIFLPSPFSSSPIPYSPSLLPVDKSHRHVDTHIPLLPLLDHSWVFLVGSSPFPDLNILCLELSPFFCACSPERNSHPFHDCIYNICVMC